MNGIVGRYLLELVTNLLLAGLDGPALDLQNAAQLLLVGLGIEELVITVTKLFPHADEVLETETEHLSRPFHGLHREMSLQLLLVLYPLVEVKVVLDRAGHDVNDAKLLAYADLDVTYVLVLRQDKTRPSFH